MNDLFKKILLGLIIVFIGIGAGALWQASKNDSHSIQKSIEKAMKQAEHSVDISQSAW